MAAMSLVSILAKASKYRIVSAAWN